MFQHLDKKSSEPIVCDKRWLRNRSSACRAAVRLKGNISGKTAVRTDVNYGLRYNGRVYDRGHLHQFEWDNEIR